MLPSETHGLYAQFDDYTVVQMSYNSCLELPSKSAGAKLYRL